MSNVNHVAGGPQRTYRFITLKENDTTTLVASGKKVACVVELDGGDYVRWKQERRGMCGKNRRIAELCGRRPAEDGRAYLQ